MVEGLEEGHAEALVLGKAHEHVGGPVVGGQHAGSDRAGQVGRPLEAQGGHVGGEGGVVGGRGRAPHQVQTGPGVIQPAVDGEGLHQVVLGLVGCHAPHEEPVAPAAGLGLLQAGQRLGVDLTVELVEVHQHRCHGDGGEAGVNQLALVVGRHGEPVGRPVRESHVGIGRIGNRSDVGVRTSAD